MQAKNLNYRSALNIVVLLIMLALFSIIMQSCSKTTSSKTGKLTGTIMLTNDTGNASLDPVDFSGITVALYKTATLDTTITRINRDYPNLGVIINQETEFDHRLQAPVKETTTNANGSFTLSNINKGRYNLVVMKQGWGIRYFYDFQIKEGSNELSFDNKGSYVSDNTSKTATVSLYPEKICTGINGSVTEFLSHHTYRITDDAIYTNSVTFNPQAMILIAPNKKAAFYGSIAINNTTSGYIKLTSDFGMYETTLREAQSIEQFYDIECMTTTTFSSNKLSAFVTTFASLGWYIKTSGVTIEDMVFRNNRMGLQFEQVENINVNRCNIVSSADIELGGITLISSSNSTIRNLIAIKCAVAVRQHTSTNSTVSNSYFYKNSLIDVYNLYETTGVVSHCTFDGSNVAIDTSGRCNTSVQYCNITARIGLYNHNQLNWHPTTFSANFNNFICSLYAVQTRSTFYGTTNPIYLNCENNYWGTAVASEINSKIWDRNDESTSHPEYNYLLGIVDYLPLKNNLIPNNGISSVSEKTLITLN